MKQKQILMIIAIMLLSISLFAINDMGKGGSYDGYAMDESTIINLGDVSLPVTLSSFTAVQTSANYAQISWTTQSENGLNGYNIYRSESNNYNNSTNLNHSLIEPTNSSSTHNYSYTDRDVEFEQTYYYWLESVELDGNTESFGPISLTIENPEIEELPNATILQSAYPNPFKPETTIKFSIKETETADFTIYNIKGQVIISACFDAGYYEYKWNAEDYPSGVYFYKLQTKGYSKTSKMLLLK